MGFGLRTMDKINPVEILHVPLCPCVLYKLHTHGCLYPPLLSTQAYLGMDVHSYLCMCGPPSTPMTRRG